MTLSTKAGQSAEPEASFHAPATASAPATMAPARRQQLIALEDALHREIALLRAQCAPPTEAPDWLMSSIDWDLSAR